MDIIYHRTPRDIAAGSIWKYKVLFNPGLDDHTQLTERHDWCIKYLEHRITIGWYVGYIMNEDDLMRYWLRWI